MSAPSLRALRAFAETTRGGSLAAASRVLHVTPSAVSHLLRDDLRAFLVEYGKPADFWNLDPAIPERSRQVAAASEGATA